jgi:hypothetical protein
MSKVRANRNTAAEFVQTTEKMLVMAAKVLKGDKR